MSKDMKHPISLHIIFYNIFFTYTVSSPSLTYANSSSTNESRFHKVWSTLDSVNHTNEPAKIRPVKDPYEVITIHNQEDFNNLNSSIATAIKEGYRNIKLTLQRGTYEYEEDHILLNGIHSNLNIVIDGKGSELVSNRTKVLGKKNPLFVYSKDNIPQDFWSDTFQLTDSIISTNDSNIYKFEIPRETDIEASDLIKISQWFVSSVYEIEKVEDGYAYFSTEYPFVSNRKDWNVNYDLKYGNTMPRLRVFKTSPDEFLAQHRSTCFIRVQNSSFESLKISNLNFWGSAYGQRGVISLAKTKTDITAISRCSFKECKSPCITLTDASNVLIDGCYFTDNYKNCIATDNQCSNTRIIHNYFKNNDRDWNNVFDITVSGNGFLIADNTIVNAPYGAIRVGDWWGSQDIRTVKGIVENNLIYDTPDFYKGYWKYTLMDSGAIYISTINDDVHVRYNRIYDIAGMKDYRGIFGDDGTCNSRIYGNVITGIKDSYSIDLRATPRVEENPQYRFGKVNVGNILMYNIVDGDIRFQGRPGENGCMKGPNILLQSRDHKTPQLKTGNIYNQEEDILLEAKQTDQERIAFSKADKKKLKQNPIYKRGANWIK